MPKNLLLQPTNSENEDQLFNYIKNTFKDKITTWEYFVNWQKVFQNVNNIEQELNILNYLIGKDNIEEEFKGLLRRYPEVISCFPALIAVRESSIEVLIEVSTFLYSKFSFKKRKLSEQEINELTLFFIKTGIARLFSERKIKNLVDYVTGIEVGLDSNGRKNRGGTLMEDIVEVYVKAVCNKLNLPYLTQANANKIYQTWGVKVEVDKSSRIIDFVVNKNGKLFFIEVNFYGGGGSKLKSTATEYVSMYNYWKAQNINFIWITDGNGWQSTLKPLREYFDKSVYLLNLELLRNHVLERIFNYA